MKLIIQKTGNVFYAYKESEKHHKIVEKDRLKESVLLPNSILENECNLNMVMNGDCHFIFELKKAK